MQEMKAGPGPSSNLHHGSMMSRIGRSPVPHMYSRTPQPTWRETSCPHNSLHGTGSRRCATGVGAVAVAGYCSAVSSGHAFPLAAGHKQQWHLSAHSQHHSSLQPHLPRLQHQPHGCRQRARQPLGTLTSTASRLTPPSASLAFAEPATAAMGAAAGGAATAATAGAGLSLSKVVAVVLGYCVMAGSLFRSLPQIIKVVQHNSTEGLSLVSYLVELCCYSVVIAYNLSQGYGFNTFGEVVACWIQDIILIALVYKDRRTSPWLVALTVVAFTAGCSFLLSPACPHQLLASLQASNIAIMALGSRLPQIVLNMRRGNAGMLSVTTCVLNVAGNAARIFTTIVLTGDVLMLGGACSQGCLNTILLWQSVSTARARARAAASSSGTPSSSSSLQQQQQLKRPQPELRSPPVGPANGPEPAAGGGFPALQPAT